MRTLTFVVLLSVISSPAAAKPPAIFVAGSGNFGTLAELTSYVSADGAKVWRVDGYLFSTGTQLEAALTSGPWSLYTGLQTVSYATETDVDYEDTWVPATFHTTRHWRQSDRLILGSRFSSSVLNRSRPMIGLGISWGWYRRSKTAQHNSGSYEYSIHQVSKGSFGIAGELGYLIPVHRRLTVSIMGRLDIINSQTGYEELHWMPKADNLYLANIQLGLQYHFRRTSGE